MFERARQLLDNRDSRETGSPLPRRFWFPFHLSPLEVWPPRFRVLVVPMKFYTAVPAITQVEVLSREAIPPESFHHCTFGLGNESDKVFVPAVNDLTGSMNFMPSALPITIPESLLTSFFVCVPLFESTSISQSLVDSLP